MLPRDRRKRRAQHLDQIPAIGSAIADPADAGLRVGLRSRPSDAADPACLVVDTMGELSSLYGLADVAFVGGPLVDVGGHNLLEPAGLGLPLVVGPHLHTVRETADDLAEADVLEVVTGPDALAAALVRLLSDTDARARASAGARAI